MGGKGIDHVNTTESLRRGPAPIRGSSSTSDNLEILSFSVGNSWSRY
jgi:hypothetical protein